jgi:hypothetical protein
MTVQSLAGDVSESAKLGSHEVDETGRTGVVGKVVNYLSLRGACGNVRLATAAIAPTRSAVVAVLTPTWSNERLAAHPESTATVDETGQRIDTACCSIPARTVPTVRRTLGKVRLLSADDRVVSPRDDRSTATVYGVAKVERRAAE